MHRNLLGLPQGQLGNPINCVVGTASTNFTTASSSITATGCSVTIYASGDYPIRISFQPVSGSTAAVVGTITGNSLNMEATVYLYRNGTAISKVTMGTQGASAGVNLSASFAAPSLLNYIDFPTKGICVYDVRVSYDGDGAGVAAWKQVSPVAFEDRNLVYK